MYMLPPPIRNVVLLLGLEAADYWGSSPLPEEMVLVRTDEGRGEAPMTLSQPTCHKTLGRKGHCLHLC